MKRYGISLLFVGIAVGFLVSISYCSKRMEKKMVNAAFYTQDIISLFALTPEEIKTKLPLYKKQAQDTIDALIALPADQRTFSNTAKALDEVVTLSNLAITNLVCVALELLSPDAHVRDAAHDACIEISNFFVDTITSNKKLYAAFMEYANGAGTTESLTDEQRYFLNDTVSSFKREGLSLPDQSLAQVKELRKELSALTADFERNIAEDSSSIAVARKDLEGLPEDFIAGLAVTEDGKYKLGIDYPTYFRVMETCAVEKTRKALYTAFNNRAYPVNDELLKTIIIKRDELARLLGFADFAHLDVDDQMAASPERAQEFIQDLITKAVPKVALEMATLTASLPKSVKLGAHDKINPWDFMFIENNYKKNHFNIDEQKIAEYFPMQNTVDQLLDIYHQFFSIDFVQVPVQGLWHEDVTAVQVVDKKGQVLGTLLLDLYPRPNKYSHAAHTTIIPATIAQDGTRIPDVSVVIGNFSKPTATQPSLLKRNEVQTFFHEFGHALHAVLGATTIASLSGTHTKRDFVELPSQMLEEWLMDKDILRKVSSHYQTGQPLPDDIIDTLISFKNLTSGYFVTRQGYLSMISLDYFGAGDAKDPYAIMKKLYAEIMTPMVFSPANHFYTSFGHLTGGYGPKYYGYLWSKVFALDIFAEIKKHGLLDPVIGQKYIKEVIGKGGSQDPNELLYNFLGRRPNSQAFLSDLGLN